MSAYRLSHAAHLSLRRRVLRFALVVIVLTIAAAVAISMTRVNATETIVIAAPVVLAVAGYAIFMSYRRRVAQLESFGLSVLETQLTRWMANVPTVTLRREEVKRIERDRSGAITIYTERETFRIPAEIEDRNALLSELGEWRPIENAKS